MGDVIKFPTAEGCTCGWKFPKHIYLDIPGDLEKELFKGEYKLEYCCPECGMRITHLMRKDD